MDTPLEFCMLKYEDPVFFSMIDSAECLAPEKGFFRTCLIISTSAGVSTRRPFSPIPIQKSLYLG